MRKPTLPQSDNARTLSAGVEFAALLIVSLLFIWLANTLDLYEQLQRAAGFPVTSTSLDEIILTVVVLTLATALFAFRRWQVAETEISLRQAAETALLSREKRFMALIANSSDAISLLSANGELIYDSPAAPGMLGYESGALVGKNLFQLIHAEDVDESRRIFHDLIAKPSERAFHTLRFLHQDGSWRWIEIVGSNLLAEPAVEAIVFNYRDVTESKRAQSELLQSEERFRLVVESVADYAILMLDPTGRVATWNLGAERIKGYTAEEIIGQHFSRFYPQADIASGKPGRALKIAIAEHVYHEEGPRVRKDGSQFIADVTITALFDQNGTLRGFAKVTRDVTERHQTQELLRQSENRFRGLIENSSDAIALFAADGTVLYGSPATVSVLGFQPDELAGHNALEFVHPDDQALLISALTTLNENPGMRLELEGRVMHKDGNWRWTEGVFTNLLEDPSVGAIVNNYRDITERKQRRRELEAMAAVSAALRAAETRADMLPVILEQSLSLLNTHVASLAMVDPLTGAIVTELGLGVWAQFTGRTHPITQNLTHQIIATGQLYLSDDISGEPSLEVLLPISDIRAIAGVPLSANQKIIGVLWIGRKAPFGPDEVHLLSALADIAGNAIHRASLYEQTQLTLRNIAALRDIDRAITGSFDLSLSLNTVLIHALAQTEVAAASILIFNPLTQRLNLSVSRGFKSNVSTRVEIRLGEGYAGRAAFERKTIYISNLAEQSDNPRVVELLAVEKFTSYYAVPLMAKGQIKGVLEVFFRGPIHESEAVGFDFLNALAGQAAIAIDNATLFAGLQRSNLDLSLAYDATIEGWSRALDLRDKETEGHTLRVTELTLRVARAAGFGDEELVHIRRGALLHDIGKMGVPDAILLKPGPLTDEEWEQMRKHPAYAYELLSPINYLHPALDIPYCHHEKWDGSGYPRGLKGEQIPLSARLFALVDVWDALRSDRPYRVAWEPEKVRDHIQSLVGTHFDPRATEIFLNVV